MIKLSQIHGYTLGSPVATVTPTARLQTTSNFEITTADAFGRLKVGNPFGSSDNIFKYDKDPLRWQEITNGSAWATHSANESAVDLFCGSGSGDEINFSERKYNRYQAGRALSVNMTGVVGDTGKDNVIRRWGLFDDENGVFYELSGTQLSAVVRSNTTGTPVDTKVAQEDFNKDTINGSGASTFNLDVSKNNIYWFEFQWLSAGRVCFGVDTDKVAGKVLAHIVQHSNDLTTPYMTTATLPIRYNQVNTADTGEQSTYKAICSTSIIEGGEDPPQEIFSAGESAEQTIGTTQQHILSIRPGSSFNSITNRMTIVPHIFSAAAETKSSTFTLLKNATLANASFGSVSPNSSVEFDIGSQTFAGGIPLAAVVVGKDDAKDFDLSSIFDIDKAFLTVDATGSVSDTLTIVAASSNANATVISDLTWGEIR